MWPYSHSHLHACTHTFTYMLSTYFHTCKTHICPTHVHVHMNACVHIQIFFYSSHVNAAQTPFRDRHSPLRFFCSSSCTLHSVPGTSHGGVCPLRPASCPVLYLRRPGHSSVTASRETPSVTSVTVWPSLSLTLSPAGAGLHSLQTASLPRVCAPVLLFLHIAVRAKPCRSCQTVFPGYRGYGQPCS